MPRKMARQPGGNAPASASNTTQPVVTPPSIVPTDAPRKIDTVVALLRREQGATLAELTEATGWLAHTARAALTGLRKKGHVLEKGKRAGVTCYHVRTEQGS